MVAVLKKAPGDVDFEPLQDFLLIRLMTESESVGGIHLPEGSTLAPPKGLVVKVGPTVNESEKPIPQESIILPGDVVYLCFATYNKPLELKFAGVDYLVVRSSEVMGRSMSRNAC